MKVIILTTFATLVAVYGFSQTYLPLTAGYGNPLSGTLIVSPDTNNGGSINIRPNAGHDGYITFTESGIADRWAMGITNGDGNLYWRIPYGSSQPVMSLSPNGNLSLLTGVLTGTSATFSGRIYGTTTASSSDFNSGGLIAYGSGTTASYTQIGYDATGNYGWITPLTTGVAYRNLALTPHGGNVGIGTTSPQMPLHVQNGPVGSDIARFANGGNGEGTRGLSIYSNDSYVKLQVSDNAGNLGDWAHLTLNPDGGDVAIGTTDTKGYKLAVKGKIRATEIKVEALPWPDYVFDPTYKLADLKETEQFIKINKHLPQIPSAIEVAKEGINVGEMNAKLLQKIEELTLYMIDFNKKMEVISSENQTLKKEVAELKAKKYF